MQMTLVLHLLPDGNHNQRSFPSAFIGKCDIRNGLGGEGEEEEGEIKCNNRHSKEIENCCKNRVRGKSVPQSVFETSPITASTPSPATTTATTTTTTTTPTTSTTTDIIIIINIIITVLLD